MSSTTTTTTPSFPVNNNSDESSHTSPFQNLKPSILVIILILCITLLVSVSLCLLLRLLNRRCLRHLSPPSTTTTTTTTITASSSNRHSGNRVSPDNVESSVLDSLPLFTYGSINRRSSAAATPAGDCAVCLSKFEAEDQLRLLPLCCHAFHAQCIDTWLQSNQTCPLCRSTIHASESDVIKAISESIGTESFRLEIGSVSRRRTASDFPAEPRSSYSIGSFEYVVEDDSEVNVNNTHRRSVSDKDIASVAEENASGGGGLAAEVGASGRSWLKDYVDRLSVSLSSRAMSFRSSGRFFSGSSRRSEVAAAAADYDLEAGRAGEEISEFFRWFSGV